VFNINPKVLIIGGAAIFSLLVLFIIFFIYLYQRRHYLHLQEQFELKNQYQRELLKTQLETQEESFYQIGEELHDNIGQLLSSARMLLGITERTLGTVPDTFRIADQTLAKAIQDLRLLTKSLNKEWLFQFNLLDNLQQEVDRINLARTVHVELISQVKSLPFMPESQVMLFRVVQEALNNSIKHSEAQSIEIRIQLSEHFTISVTDDGKGFAMNDAERSGIGLLSMNHRTALLGGQISWHSLNPGTEVQIIIPVENKYR
jgi:signal transduction histidine kinase